MPTRSLQRFAPLVPYLAVLIGLYALQSAWAALLGYHAGMALVLTLEGAWPAARRLREGWRTWAALAGVGIGLLAGGAIYLCWPWFGVIPDLTGALARIGLPSQRWPVLGIYFLGINPWLEELYWRGYLGSPAKGLVWHDVCFAAYHLLVLAPFLAGRWLIPTLLALIGLAWLWRQMARQFAGLAIPVLAHLCADLGLVLAIYLRLSTT